MIIPASRLNRKSLQFSIKASGGATAPVASNPSTSTAPPSGVKTTQKDGEYKDSLGRRYCIQNGMRVDCAQKPQQEGKEDTDKKTDGEPDYSDPKFAKEWDEEVAKHIPDIKENNASDHDFDVQQLAAEQNWHADYIKYRYGLNVGKNEIKPDEIPMAARMMSGLLNPKMGEDYIQKLEQQYPTKGKVRPNVANAVIAQLRKLKPNADSKLINAVGYFAAGLFGHQASAVAKHLAENNVDLETGEEKEPPKVEGGGKYGEWQPPSEKQGGNEDDHRQHWMNQLKKKANVNGIKLTPELEEQARQAIKENVGKDHLDHESHGNVAEELEKILGQAEQSNAEEEKAKQEEESQDTRPKMEELPPAPEATVQANKVFQNVLKMSGSKQEAAVNNLIAKQSNYRTDHNAQAEVDKINEGLGNKEQDARWSEQYRPDDFPKDEWRQRLAKGEDRTDLVDEFRERQKNSWNEAKMTPEEIGLWDAAYSNPATSGNVPKPPGYDERRDYRLADIRRRVELARRKGRAKGENRAKETPEERTAREASEHARMAKRRPKQEGRSVQFWDQYYKENPQEKPAGWEQQRAKLAKPKALSWLDNSNGGALVAPPAMKLQKSRLQWLGKDVRSPQETAVSIDLNPSISVNYR